MRQAYKNALFSPGKKSVSLKIIRIDCHAFSVKIDLLLNITGKAKILVSYPIIEKITSLVLIYTNTTKCLGTGDFQNLKNSVMLHITVA